MAYICQFSPLHPALQVSHGMLSVLLGRKALYFVHNRELSCTAVLIYRNSVVHTSAT